MTRATIRLTLSAATVAALFTAGPTVSQTAFTDSSGDSHGVWRDAEGHEWCGGNCAAGQRCCTWTTITP
jgi:hypothetical protein